MAESVSPYKIKPDPRTDGVEEDHAELEPLSDEQVREGAEHDRARAIAADDSEWAIEEGELKRIPMRQITEDEEAQDNW
jgi:hypothetical protein